MSVYVVRALGPWIGPRTNPRVSSPFKASWTDTVDLLNREIEALQTRAQRQHRWVLQMDVPAGQIRLDGEVYARATPASPAIRVSFDSQHGPLMYATDRFTHWQANVRAVALSLEALRRVDRYGVAGAGEQYQGWAQISDRPHERSRAKAAEFICRWAGLGTTAELLAGGGLAAAYRAAAKRLHPDAGGDPGLMAELTAARDLLAAGGRP